VLMVLIYPYINPWFIRKRTTKKAAVSLIDMRIAVKIKWKL
jgi:hypothetical protein